MKITGLSIQSRTPLFDFFAPDPKSETTEQLKSANLGGKRLDVAEAANFIHQMRRANALRLLQHLSAVDGPDLWVGYSGLFWT